AHRTVSVRTECSRYYRALLAEPAGDLDARSRSHEYWNGHHRPTLNFIRRIGEPAKGIDIRAKGLQRAVGSTTYQSQPCVRELPFDHWPDLVGKHSYALEVGKIF